MYVFLRGTNMKKSVVLLSAGLVCSLLASCGPTSSNEITSENTATDTTSSSDEVIDVEISIGTSFKDDFRGSALDAIISEFNTANQHITVSNRFIDTNYNKIFDNVTASFTAATYPDLVVCYADHVTSYIKEGFAVNLDTYIENGMIEDKEDIIPAYLEEGAKFTTPGTYMVPFNKSTEYMLYNSDVLEGLDLTKINAKINEGKALSAAYLQSLTWEEFFDVLCPALISYNETLDAEHKIISINGDETDGILAYESDQNSLISMIIQNDLNYVSIKDGEGSFDFNNPEVKNLVKKLAGYAKKGYISTKGSSGKYNSELMAKKSALFEITSSTGTSYFGTNQYQKNNINYGFAKVPYAAGKARKVISQGTSLCLLSNNKDSSAKAQARRNAAAKFYGFLSNKANSLDWAIKSGYEPIRNSIFEHEEYLSFTDTTQYTDKKSSEYLAAKGHNFIKDFTNDYFTTPAFIGSAAARTQMGGIMTKAATNRAKDVTDVEIDTWFNDAMAICIAAAK